MKYQVMKVHGFLFGVFLSAVSLSASAGWEVSQPRVAVPREPFFQANKQQTPVPVTQTSPSPVLHKQYAHTAAANPIQPPHKHTLYLGQPAPAYAASMSGSVKENLERIMGRYHWRVILESAVRL